VCASSTGGLHIHAHVHHLDHTACLSCNPPFGHLPLCMHRSSHTRTHVSKTQMILTRYLHTRTRKTRAFTHDIKHIRTKSDFFSSVLFLSHAGMVVIASRSHTQHATRLHSHNRLLRSTLADSIRWLSCATRAASRTTPWTHSATLGSSTYLPFLEQWWRVECFDGVFDAFIAKRSRFDLM
jgi:hypothetical protein